MQAVAAIIAAVGLTFLTATGLAKLWALWVKHRESRTRHERKGLTFRRVEDFYLARGILTEAPEPPGEPMTSNFEIEPTERPKAARRRSRYRQEESLAEFFNDVLREVGFRLKG